MPWTDEKLTCGSTEITTRHFKCGWCGVSIVIDVRKNVPFGWVMSKKPDPQDYFCSRRCRYDFLTVEGN